MELGHLHLRSISAIFQVYSLKLVTEFLQVLIFFSYKMGITISIQL